jgi:hypothetical protein
VTALATCAGPDCEASLSGRPATTRFCSETCRKRAHRARMQAERQTAATTGPRSSTPRVDPERVLAMLEAFRRALRSEAERSLKRDPSRWRWTSSADRDHPRATPGRTQGRRAAP